MSGDDARRRLAIRNYYATNRDKPPLVVLAGLQKRWPDLSEDDLTNMVVDVADLTINQALSAKLAGSA